MVGEFYHSLRKANENALDVLFGLCLGVCASLELRQLPSPRWDSSHSPAPPLSILGVFLDFCFWFLTLFPQLSSMLKTQPMWMMLVRQSHPAVGTELL